MYEAQSTRDRCVKKMRKIGYVKIPEVHVGISPDWKTNPASLSNL